jgi:hypothetical protein
VDNASGAHCRCRGVVDKYSAATLILAHNTCTPEDGQLGPNM